MNRIILMAFLFLPAAPAAAAEPARAPAAKQPGVAADMAKKRARLQALRSDPVRLELYRLREALRTSTDPKKKEALAARVRELTLKLEAAEAQARLTPERKAELAEKKRRKEAEQAELAPLLARLRAAATPEQREAALAAIKEARAKYE